MSKPLSLIKLFEIPDVNSIANNSSKLGLNTWMNAGLLSIESVKL